MWAYQTVSEKYLRVTNAGTSAQLFLENERCAVTTYLRELTIKTIIQERRYLARFGNPW